MFFRQIKGMKMMNEIPALRHKASAPGAPDPIHLP
jgi:hypothetical protein